MGKMRNFDAYVLQRIAELQKQNALKAQIEVLDYMQGDAYLPKYLQKKVERFCGIHGFNFYEVLASIAASEVVAAQFAKVATRQRVAELCQLERLNKDLAGPGVSKLTNNGNNSVRLTDSGEILVGPKPLGFSGTKSMDAKRVHVNGVVDFLYLKWTNSSGGSQDNQFYDVLHFLSTAAKYVENNQDYYRFFAITDGPYYERVMHLLKQYERPDRLMVMSTDSYVKACNQVQKYVHEKSS
jgi:hypothetical protein